MSSIFWLLIPLIFLVAFVDVLTASPQRRARILRAAGHTQAAIADRLGVSRYRVRQYLAA